MEKFRNKYRIASARAQWWDYGWNGAYFMTICTEKRQHYFGEIEGAEMNISPMGTVADILWYEIPNHAQFVELGDFIVMPNHIHGILIIDRPDGYGNVDVISDLPQNQSPSREQTIDHQSIGRNRFQNIGKNTISSIVGGYKSAVTKHANRLGFINGWQSSFHDHIIRNDAEYQRISDYIINNVAYWKDDKFYTE